MKKKVLLLDESLTVQKVVALTLDRNRYAVSYAKSRSEAMKWILETAPDLILVSDQVADINVALFPKEVESWMGRDRRPAPIILITGQDVKEARAYQAVLRKPFSPQALQAVVVEHTQGQGREEAPRPAEAPRTPARTPASASDRPASEPSARSEKPERTLSGVADDPDDHRLQRIFSDTFNDEEKLTRETFHNEEEEEERTLLTIPAPPRGGAAKPAPKEEGWPPTSRDAGREKPGGRTVPAAPPPPPETAAELWGAVSNEEETGSILHELPVGREEAAPLSPILGAEDSMAYKAVLENKVEDSLRSQDLERLVEKHLERLLPAIVERLVQERLDNLLKEQEEFVELKP